MFVFLAVALLQTQPTSIAPTTPSSGDTVGYWQQGIRYTIVATLDEEQSKLRARGTLVYVNNSPDTLRELYVHQYLNAFRPGSKWSAADQRENRVRFQALGEPDYGYERFTAPPVVNETPVVVDYPGAPDSTIAHFRLPSPLAPRDSIRVTFEWEARPSTLPRRQGRRGRTYDFAQWYPKVVVYDRRGWEINALIPAGELYGEFGTYDVTMIVRDDQVLASTGVPVSGDPGWARVSRTGAPYLGNTAYATIPVLPAPTIPAGSRAVRFLAENVHHFAWSASPDYRYEGGTYVRPVPKLHFQTWDTVGVHVLFKPGDDSTWGGGRALDRTIVAARWLESIWGPYAYPQITNVHRIDGGGTEFPMMIMDGSASQGLILHEFGHVFSYGILGNNEWRSGWLDEGLTDYQTDWAQKLTPHEQIGRLPEPPLLAEGYRVNGASIPRADSMYLRLWQNEVHDRSQPIGTAAYDFREFGVYNTMVYERAKLMYSHLRDAMGDSLFLAFLHDYYSRWALKHVDELAMRASVERVAGTSYAWFFDQWVHGTGLMDYALHSVRVATDGARFETTVVVGRNGELKHPMPVGVRTASGWTIGRADAVRETQEVRIVTTERPLRVEIDPHHVTWDWDRRNNIQSGFLFSVREPRLVFAWPYLDQADRSRTIVTLAPVLWYTNPQGPVFGIRSRTNYLSAVDIQEAGLAFTSRNPHNAEGEGPSFGTRINVWARAENLYIPGLLERPLMGYGAGVYYLDGLLKLDAYKTWDFSPFVFAPGPTIEAKTYLTGVVPTSSLLLPEQWTKTNLVEGGATGLYKSAVDADSGYTIARASFGVGLTSGAAGTSVSRGYLRGEGSVGAVFPIVGTSSQVRVRGYGGIARRAPLQRTLFASSQNPLETFTNDLFRGRGALLKQEGANFLPLGGAGIRGFKSNVALESILAANGELIQRVASARGPWGRATVSLAVFTDVGVTQSGRSTLPETLLADWGAGIGVRGRFYDRDVNVRLDAPIFVNQAGFAGAKLFSGRGSFAPRLMLTAGELW
jgi:hypothetical protein